MASKVVVLGACCSGKSSLCEQLRADHRSVIECDEAVMLAAGGSWPASAEENHRRVIEVAGDAIAMTDVIFLTSWIPIEMLGLAHGSGFTVALLSVPMPELERRNNQRLVEGGYSDMSHWFVSQLDNYADLRAIGLIDVVLDGTLTTAALATTAIASQPAFGGSPATTVARRATMVTCRENSLNGSSGTRAATSCAGSTRARPSW